MLIWILNHEIAPDPSTVHEIGASPSPDTVRRDVGSRRRLRAHTLRLRHERPHHRVLPRVPGSGHDAGGHPRLRQEVAQVRPPRPVDVRGLRPGHARSQCVLHRVRGRPLPLPGGRPAEPLAGVHAGHGRGDLQGARDRPQGGMHGSVHIRMRPGQRFPRR